MIKNQPATRAVAPTRFRGLVTAMLVMALSLLIVRDIIIRRWGSPTPPSPDVTQRLP